MLEFYDTILNLVSTIELEYITIAKAAKKALWLTRLFKELGVKQDEVQLHCSSYSVIFFIKN